MIGTRQNGRSIGSLLALGLLSVACGGAPKSEGSVTPKAPTPPAEPALHDDRNVVRKDEAPACASKSPLACEARCNGGEAASCSSLGDMYLDGKGVSKDPKRATLLFVSACDHGDAYGCAQGARLVEESGTDGAADPARAVEMYRKGCDAGYEASCNDLGFTAERGIGQPKDVPFAYSMYVRSCGMGGAYGCYNKAAFLEVGKGGAGKDPAAAAKIYEKTCAAGFNFGCGALGHLYARGRGVPRDEQRGLRMLQESCDSGYKWSCDVIKKLQAERGAAASGG